mmetsp:Transcript_19105/g.54251  ORF Transcript_19105/g.54251 Transcript_19105/m.54251 type:complete len:545 (+) Transcript_19105:1903-3537(+)
MDDGMVLRACNARKADDAPQPGWTNLFQNGDALEHVATIASSSATSCNHRNLGVVRGSVTAGGHRQDVASAGHFIPQPGQRICGVGSAVRVACQLGNGIGIIALQCLGHFERRTNQFIPRGVFLLGLIARKMILLFGVHVEMEQTTLITVPVNVDEVHFANDRCERDLTPVTAELIVGCAAFHFGTFVLADGALKDGQLRIKCGGNAFVFVGAAQRDGPDLIVAWESVPHTQPVLDDLWSADGRLVGDFLQCSLRGSNEGNVLTEIIHRLVLFDGDANGVGTIHVGVCDVWRDGGSLRWHGRQVWHINALHRLGGALAATVIPQSQNQPDNEGGDRQQHEEQHSRNATAPLLPSPHVGNGLRLFFVVLLGLHGRRLDLPLDVLLGFLLDLLHLPQRQPVLLLPLGRPVGICRDGRRLGQTVGRRGDERGIPDSATAFDVVAACVVEARRCGLLLLPHFVLRGLDVRAVRVRGDLGTLPHASVLDVECARHDVSREGHRVGIGGQAQVVLLVQRLASGHGQWLRRWRRSSSGCSMNECVDLWTDE